jgi:hypothetical protein
MSAHDIAVLREARLPFARVLAGSDLKKHSGGSPGRFTFTDAPTRGFSGSTVGTPPAKPPGTAGKELSRRLSQVKIRRDITEVDVGGAAAGAGVLSPSGSPPHSPSDGHGDADCLDVAMAAAAVLCTPSVAQKLSPEGVACVLGAVRAALHEDRIEPAVALLGAFGNLLEFLWTMLRFLNASTASNHPDGDASARQGSAAGAGAGGASAAAVVSPSLGPDAAPDAADVSRGVVLLGVPLADASDGAIAALDASAEEPVAIEGLPPQGGPTGHARSHSGAASSTDSATTTGFDVDESLQGLGFASAQRQASAPEYQLHVPRSPGRKRSSMQEDEPVRAQNALMCIELLGLLCCPGVSTVWLTRVLSLMHPGRAVPDEWRFQALAACVTMAQSAVVCSRMPSPALFFSFVRPYERTLSARSSASAVVYSAAGEASWSMSSAIASAAASAAAASGSGGSGSGGSGSGRAAAGDLSGATGAGSGAAGSAAAAAAAVAAGAGAGAATGASSAAAVVDSTPRGDEGNDNIPGIELRGVSWPFAKEYMVWCWVRVRTFATTSAAAARPCILSVSLDATRFEIFVSPKRLVLRLELVKGASTELELEAVSESIVPGQWFSVAVHHARCGVVE